MSIEIILFGVVALVLVLDFALKGVKKKNIQEDVERIGEEQSKKKAFNFNYILERKRNISTFILLVILFKPLIHFQFFTEEEEFINTEKKFPAPDKRKDFIALANINHEVVKIYKTYFYVYRDGNGPLWEPKPLRQKDFSKNYFLETTEFDLNKFDDNLDIAVNDFIAFDKGNHWRVRLIEDVLIYDNYVGVLCQLGNWIIKYNHLIEYRKNIFFFYDNNGKLACITPIVARDDYNDPAEIIKDNGIIRFGYYISSQYPFWYKVSTKEFKNENGIIDMLKSGMYMDYDTKLIFDSEGNQVIVEKDGRSTNFFIHPLETRKTDIKNHFDRTLKTKLWLFAVSFASLGVLVLLFNDKIKAR
jgi:uncharacterized membrane protein YsdA (DUF1294 family)